MISVVEVDVSDDLKFAKIYLSIYDSNDSTSIDDVVNRINKNKNMIKFKLGNALKAKYVPEIKFFKSDEYEYFDNINSLINKATNE